MSNPVGRPRTSIKDLPLDWYDLMIAAAQDGASDIEIRCILGISQTGWTTLLEDSDEFSIAVKKAKDKCQIWWERHGRKMAKGESDGNATVWIFNMKNRFGWKDKTETELVGANGGAINHSIEVTFVKSAGNVS